MALYWLSFVEGAVILVLAAVILSHGAAGLKWYRLTPALRKRFNKLPKGSLGWPFLGETLALQQCLMSTTPHSFVTERRRRYGDVFLTHLFGKPVLASTNPDTNKYILTKEELFSTTLPQTIVMAVGKNALLLLQGERHKRLRRLVCSVSSPDTLKFHASQIHELAITALRTWKDREVIVVDEARNFSFFCVLRVLLGKTPDPLSERLRSKFMELRAGARSLPLDLPGTSYRKAIQARHALKEMLEELIKQRKQEKGIELAKHADLLDKLIHLHEEDGGSALTNDEIIDMILSTLLAGFDTTANALLFLIYYTGEHRHLLRDLKVEHEEILNGKDKETSKLSLTFEDYKKMKLTQLAINETLRLSNPVLSCHRVTALDFECNGSVIPAGSAVQVWLRTIHTDPTIYSQPYDFDTNRWKDKSINMSNNFFPFGVGPRLCAGMELARMELAFFLHSLLTMYSWELAEDDSPKFFPEPGMRKGLPIRVREL